MKISIAVIDYGMSNLRSVVKALMKAEMTADVVIADTVEAVRSADRVVLPGQSAMPSCIQNINGSWIRESVFEAYRTKPLLGVCVGEQILFDWSAEGGTRGLSILPGKVYRFSLDTLLQDDGSRFKVPQIGWNRVRQIRSHPLWDGIADNSYFYFSHSYYVVPENQTHISGETVYGVRFASAVAQDNLFATQFHPEKSSKIGLRLYHNFIHWNP